MADSVANLADLRTAPGTAALAVVELRGPLAKGFVAGRFTSSSTAVVRHGRWGELDDPLVIAAGEAFEIHLHGGRQIVRRLLDDAAAFGFDVAGDVVRPTGRVADDLMFAETPAAVRLLAAQPALWRAAARSGAAVDAGDLTLRRLLAPAAVALVGAANVGKSTLANLLSGRDGSPAAVAAGTTRDWVEQPAVLLGEVPVRLLDLPGVRADADDIERAAMANAQAALRAADLVIEVRSPDVPAEPLPRAAHLTIWTKPDVAPPPTGSVTVNGRSGEGLAAVERAITQHLGVRLDAPPRPLVWCDWQARQFESGSRGVAEVARRAGEA